MKSLALGEIKQILATLDPLPLIEEGFVEYSKGLVNVPPIGELVMDKGEAAMRAEFERLTPLMKDGGFIPSVDHQTPPHVTIDQYRLFLRLLEEYTATAAP